MEITWLGVNFIFNKTRMQLTAETRLAINMHNRDINGLPKMQQQQKKNPPNEYLQS